MSDLPADDDRDRISVGPIENIPIIEDDDPRFESERAAWSDARQVAQSLVSAEELLAGMENSNWRVRHEVVDRLVARAPCDPRTLPILLDKLARDESWQVRDVIALAIISFGEDQRVGKALRAALNDEHEGVRESAELGLSSIKR